MRAKYTNSSIHCDTQVFQILYRQNGNDWNLKYMLRPIDNNGFNIDFELRFFVIRLLILKKNIVYKKKHINNMLNTHAMNKFS